MCKDHGGPVYLLHKLLQWANVYIYVKALSNLQAHINTGLDDVDNDDDGDDPVVYNQDNYTRSVCLALAVETFILYLFKLEGIFSCSCPAPLGNFLHPSPSNLPFIMSSPSPTSWDWLWASRHWYPWSKKWRSVYRIQMAIFKCSSHGGK